MTSLHNFPRQIIPRQINMILNKECTWIQPRIERETSFLKYKCTNYL